MGTGRTIGSCSPSRLRYTLCGPVASAVRGNRRAGRATTTRTRRRRVAVCAPHVERPRALRLESRTGHPGHARKARVCRARSGSVTIAVEGRVPAPLPASRYPKEAGVSRRTEVTAKHGRHASEHRRHTASHTVRERVAHHATELGVQTPDGAHGRRTVTVRATTVARFATRGAAPVVAAIAAPGVKVGTAATTESEREATHDCGWW